MTAHLKLDPFSTILLVVLGMTLHQCQGQAASQDKNERYAYKTGDPNGIGKWYMGRQIAHVMGYQGMSWLERPEREKEEETSTLFKNMDIEPGDTIADIGAGSGYHVFPMAKMVGEGHIYAVDIQPQMLAEIERKKKSNATFNISTVKGNAKSIHLKENSVDKVLLVDVYHEFDHPYEMMNSIKSALRKNGKVYLIEYRGEDASVPIKAVHKMTQAQAVKEMEAVGFKLQENMNNLPWQHCMVFVEG